MSLNKAADAINNIPDPATRNALFLLYAEMKAAFNGHTHVCAAADAVSSGPGSDTATKSATTSVAFPS